MSGISGGGKVGGGGKTYYEAVAFSINGLAGDGVNTNSNTTPLVQLSFYKDGGSNYHALISITWLHWNPVTNVVTRLYADAQNAQMPSDYVVSPAPAINGLTLYNMLSVGFYGNTNNYSTAANTFSGYVIFAYADK